MAGRSKVNKTKSSSLRTSRQAKTFDNAGAMGADKARLLAEAQQRVREKQANQPKPQPVTAGTLTGRQPPLAPKPIIKAPPPAPKPVPRSVPKPPPKPEPAAEAPDDAPMPKRKPLPPGLQRLSPVARGTALEPEPLPHGPQGWRCPKSGGRWINSQDYQEWHAERPALTADAAKAAAEPLDLAKLKAGDSGAGKRCPEDGGFLIAHRVGQGLPFQLDRCGACGGIWLDAGEWNALLSLNLHGELTRIFTTNWQAKVRREEQSRARDESLRNKLGPKDFERLRTVSKWLRDHPHRNLIVARLQEP